MENLNRYFGILLTVVLIAGCRDQLDIDNPNEPVEEEIRTEPGMLSLGQSVYITGRNPATDEIDNFSWLWFAHANHEIAGDAMFIPWGNFSWRWVNQPTWIQLDDGTVVTPPQGGSQAQELQLRNTRAFGDDNAFLHEWQAMYRINNSANLILQFLGEGVEFTGDAAAKEGALRAWAHWWKGYAYSRIGSMYVAGLINDEPAEVNPDFVDNSLIIEEANRQFDLAIAELSQIEGGGGFLQVMQRVIPVFLTSGATGYPTPEMFIRNINTMKARNILVNTRQEEITQAQWEQILALTAEGLQPGDFNFVMRQDDVFLTTAWLPPRFAMGWQFVSERLIQDIHPEDQRLERNFTLWDQEDWEVNVAGRGIIYGTRWDIVPIGQGGDFASEAPGEASVFLAGTYEENALMAAEAMIFTGNMEEGLARIDEVREFQNAGLPAASTLAGNQEEAAEELRRERRLGLFLRGLAFYDARRWGVIDPVEQGGGRTGAWVLDGTGNLHTNAVINYNYLPYWGVPENELVFNPPAPNSANVHITPQ